MKIPQPARRPRTDVDMVPMINFAFLLLIFFMLVGRFGPLDAFAVDPPRADAPPVEGEADADLLLIGKDGRIAFGRERIDRADVGTHAANWQVAHPGQALQVKADADADAAELVDLLAVLRDAGVGEIRLLTRPVRGTR